MNVFKKLCLLIPALLFCNGCHEPIGDEYHFTFYNDSNEIIRPAFSMHGLPFTPDNCYLQDDTRTGWYSNGSELIMPHTRKVIDVYYDLNDDFLRTDPDAIRYVGFYNFNYYVSLKYREVSQMSCEEFCRTFPLRKVIEFSLEDLEASNWTFIYSPEE